MAAPLPAAHRARACATSTITSSPASTIDGDWSDPVPLNSSGFDPSLFHDDDGRKYLLNQLWDHRPGRNRFAGIVLQEYAPEERRLIGERTNIFPGTPLGLTEAPHLYKRERLLLSAHRRGRHRLEPCGDDGARAHPARPYELHPDTYILSSRTRPDAPLQRAGHADLVDTPDGRTWMAYLCGRPLPNRGRCVLGRETALQPMRWDADDWLYTLDRRPASPMLEAPALDRPALPAAPDQARYDFDAPGLPIDLQWLRTPSPTRSSA
jgi:xylan 1,4-beta-xylosidase